MFDVKEKQNNVRASSVWWWV